MKVTGYRARQEKAVLDWAINMATAPTLTQMVQACDERPKVEDLMTYNRQEFLAAPYLDQLAFAKDLNVAEALMTLPHGHPDRKRVVAEVEWTFSVVDAERFTARVSKT